MGRPYRPGRPAVRRAEAAAIGLAVLLAGCGTARAPGLHPAAGTRTGGPGTAVSGPSPGTAAGRTGPSAGSRALALALARGMLARLVLPPGSRAARLRPVPEILRGPAQQTAGGSTSADLHRFFRVPRQMPAAYGFLTSHVPVGYRLTVHGGGQLGPGGSQAQFTGYTPRPLPRGVFAATLLAEVVAGPHGGSLLRADAQVTWYPARTPAEHLRAAAFRAVAVSRMALNPAPRTTTRTVTSPGGIARLAALINGLPAGPGGAVSCPAGTVTYRLAFLPAAARQPRVVVTADGCPADGIAVAGKAQPALWDPGSRLAARVNRLLAGAGRA